MVYRAWTLNISKDIYLPYIQQIWNWRKPQNLTKTFLLRPSFIYWWWWIKMLGLGYERWFQFWYSYAYSIYVLRLIDFARICLQDFSKRHQLLVCKLINQEFSIIKLKKVFYKFQNRYQYVLMKYHADLFLSIFMQFYVKVC